jgi:hypothetical protein
MSLCWYQHLSLNDVGQKKQLFRDLPTACMQSTCNSPSSISSSSISSSWFCHSCYWHVIPFTLLSSFGNRNDGEKR